MADILRLKSYKTFLNDGRSSVTYDVTKGSVAVAVIVGHEPLRLDGNNALDVDRVILEMARHIRKCRRNEPKKVAKDR